jgi:hypothetical protein
MKAEATSGAPDVASVREQVTERMLRKLEKYLPRSGELRSWTISEIEESLLQDMKEIACDIVESRLLLDPLRNPSERPVCSKCGRALAGIDVRSTRRKTMIGPIRYERFIGYCQACGLAFSPSGQCVAIRRGLL